MVQVVAGFWGAGGVGAAERQMVDKALEIDADLVDAWAYLFTHLKDKDGEDKAVAEMEKLGLTLEELLEHKAAGTIL